MKNFDDIEFEMTTEVFNDLTNDLDENGRYNAAVQHGFGNGGVMPTGQNLHLPKSINTNNGNPNMMGGMNTNMKSNNQNRPFNNNPNKGMYNHQNNNNQHNQQRNNMQRKRPMIDNTKEHRNFIESLNINEIISNTVSSFNLQK